MELVILLAVMSALGIFTIKCMKREDEIIELEDKIIDDFRAFFRSGKSSKNNGIHNVELKTRKTENRAA